MRLRTRALWLPKAGHRAAEYEDACCPTRSKKRWAAEFRCAVADGATEASFSGLWARMLVQSFCSGEIGARSLSGDLTAIQRAWHLEVEGKQLPWYAEEKLRLGAFSSLLGFTMHPEGRDRWEAMAVGDSCLFQVREGELCTAFPLASSDDFDNRPNLISSMPIANDRLESFVSVAEGECFTGDSFYLMTDALASWFLREWEEGGRPWSTLDAFASRSGLARFAGWISELRDSRRIRNDDVTLLGVRME
ncbi:MAG TPA: protein phosphatase 2C domain-containing protein [Chloroflexota bacterium]